MKLGTVCHALGRHEDSYRAFMRAADEFKRQGDDRAALDAYGRAVKDALSGAEGSNSVAEFLTESRPMRLSATGGLRSLGALQTRPLTLEKAALTPDQAAQAVVGTSATRKGTGANDEPVVGSIATVEVLFGLGRFSEAVAVMKSLAAEHPKDPRIRRKLTGLCARPEMPEPSSAFRELASAYLAAGDAESYADCMASALKMAAAGSKTTSLAVAGGNGVVVAPTRPPVEGLRAAEGATVLAGAGSTTHAPGRGLKTVSVKIRSVRWSRYWAAAVFVALLGMAGGYMVIRGSQSRSGNAANASVNEADSPKVADASLITPVSEPEASEEPARTGEGQVPQGASRETVQRQQQATTQSRSVAGSPEAAAEPQGQGQEQPKPTPPTVGSIAMFSSAGGAGQNTAPGTISTEIPPPPPPPTPRPSVRKSAVRAGGEVVRRMQPAYPAAARSAHITGTVVVELVVNERGSVTSARASSGPPLLAGAAEAAARGFKFTPITLDGVPVKSNQTVLFHFKE
jgi:TonB family protein